MKRKIAYWALYDFANSIASIAFLFYFSQWLVIDRGMPAWWYNGTLIVSSLLFVVSAPYISKRIDTNNIKIVGLRLWSLLTFLGLMSVSLLAMLTQGFELLVSMLYALSLYAYLVSFLYFTPMLNDLSSTENRSWVSGLGHSANFIGMVAGILLVLPFVNGVTLFGAPGHAQALLPATIIFGLLSLPLLIFYTEDAATLPLGLDHKSQPSMLSMFKSVFSNRSLALLFLAYFLFSDALLTFSNNFSLYLEVVLHPSDTAKSLLTAGILVLASLGAIIFGKISDKHGELKMLKKIIAAWCLLFMLIPFVTNLKLLLPLLLIAGILYGPVWAISRSMVGKLAPPELLASSYSYYVVAERFSTFIGPMVWSVALITMGSGVRGYQAGLISLGVLMACSLFVVNKIKEPRIS